MGGQYHVAGRVMNVPAEALGWRLTLGREGLSGLSNDKHPARSGFGEVLVIYPPYPMGVPFIHHVPWEHPFPHQSITIQNHVIGI
jgi:hypothetical protein